MSEVFQSLEKFVPPERLPAWHQYVAYRSRYEPSDEIGQIIEAGAWLSILTCETPEALGKKLDLFLENFDAAVKSEIKAHGQVQDNLGKLTKAVEDETARVEQRLKGIDAALVGRQGLLVAAFEKNGGELLEKLKKAEESLERMDKQIIARAYTTIDVLDRMAKKVDQAGETAQSSINKHGNAALSVLVGGMFLAGSLASYVLAFLCTGKDSVLWPACVLIPPVIGVGLIIWGIRSATVPTK